MNKLTLVIPAYNEEESLKIFLPEILSFCSKNNFNLIVVNDGSKDETSEILSRFKNSFLQVYHHKVNQGYGSAIKTGIRACKTDYLIPLDADGQHLLDDVSHLFNYIIQHDADMVVGSRTGSKVAIPLLRKPAKWILNSLANYLTGVKIPDLNSGLRIFSKEVINIFTPICPNGFSFTTTITLALLTNNYSVSFIPINYDHRIGKSKIRPVRDSINFFNLIIRTVTYFAPLKVFIPISLILALIGIGLLVYRAITGGGLAVTIVVIFLAALQIATVGLLADLISKFTSLSKTSLRDKIKDE